MASISASSTAPEEQIRAQALTESVLQQAIERYTQYVGDTPRPKPQVDPSQWKLVKNYEGMNVYKSTQRRHTAVYGSLGSRVDPTMDYWTPTVQLLGVGTIFATIEDAMYGCFTPTELDMAIRSKYLRDGLCEHRVLEHMQHPTEEEPFRYLGIKRVVRPSHLCSVLRPREVIFLEATGMTNIQVNGQAKRMGYVIHHSIERSNAISLATGWRLSRSHISSVLLFTQRTMNIVDVFNVMASDHGGSSSLSCATGVATMMASYRLSDYFLGRKMAWLLASRLSAEPSDNVPLYSEPTHNRECSGCQRKVSAFRSLSHCEVCHCVRCSKCSMNHQLVFAQSKIKFFQRSVTVCKLCIRHVQNLDPVTLLASPQSSHPQTLMQKTTRRHGGHQGNRADQLFGLRGMASGITLRRRKNDSQRWRLVSSLSRSKRQNLRSQAESPPAHDRKQQRSRGRWKPRRAHRSSLAQETTSSGSTNGPYSDDDSRHEDTDRIDEEMTIDELHLEPSPPPPPFRRRENLSFRGLVRMMSDLVNTAEETSKIAKRVSSSIEDERICFDP